MFYFPQALYNFAVSFFVIYSLLCEGTCSPILYSLLFLPSLFHNNEAQKCKLILCNEIQIVKLNFQLFAFKHFSKFGMTYYVSVYFNLS